MSQLAMLRKRIAPLEKRQSTSVLGQLSGHLATTTLGQHWEVEERYGRHGNVDTLSLARLPAHLLRAISGGTIQDVPPTRWAFLDTETTGLAGGTGTVAFLVGVGRITAEGFAVRQFFMRDFGEESSQLAALAEHLSGFDVLVTYNGKSFDAPLLETRYRMNRARPPLARLEHVDLLHGARRLWKLRFESCRLVELEQQILGYTRVGDVPGEQIPQLYYDFVKRPRPALMAPVLEHNRLDIVSLACLTAIVPRAIEEPHQIEFACGQEMIGLGRWLLATERYDEGLALLRRGVDQAIPDELMFKTLWEIAVTEKRLGRGSQAFAVLIESNNPYRGQALEQLAIHYEHREKNLARALECAEAAQATQTPLPTLARRRQRLAAKLDRTQRRLL
ncbi:MAG: ribonuclease H-like domain-containing protein [Bryobacteraceae bacterium]|nr:ribonuclease H-like domain-containing protein [Bryobacteraceae bacterium]